MNRTEPTEYIVPSVKERVRKDTFKDYFWLAALWCVLAAVTIVVVPISAICLSLVALKRIVETEIKQLKEKGNFNT